MTTRAKALKMVEPTGEAVLSMFNAMATCDLRSCASRKGLETELAMRSDVARGVVGT